MAQGPTGPASPTRKPTPIDVWLWRCFLPSQRRWILERARIAALLKTRQGGFSDATAAGAVLGGFVERRPQLVLSVSEDRSAEVLQQARLHCKTLAAFGAVEAVDFAVDNTSEIAWRRGGRIVALPANARTARALHGDIWLDEFAYHQDPEGIQEGAFAMTTRQNYRVRILSTPNGAQGLFHEWAHGLEKGAGPPGWVLHRVTIDDMIAEGMRVDMNHLLALAGGDDRIFDQWYRCMWLDANMQYIPTVLADAARDWSGTMPDFSSGHVMFYAGLDVGRHHDLTVLTVIAVVRGIAWVLAVMTCPRTAFKEQKKMVRDARDVFGWSKLYIDRTGMGEQLAEELTEAFGAEECEGLPFTAQLKEELATRSLRWFRDNRVRFPRGDEGHHLHRETCALRRIVHNASVSYDIKRGPDGHGDRYWSFALALKGAGEPAQPRGMGARPLLSVA